MLNLGATATVIDETAFETSDPAFFWYVAEGSVDQFMVARSDDGDEGRWRPLLSAGPGTLIPGLPPAGFVVVAKPAPGSRVERVSREALRGLSHSATEELEHGIDSWLDEILAQLAGEELPPREFTPIEAGEEIELGEGEVARPVEGTVWIEAPGVRLRGRSGSRILTPGELVPAAETDWLVSEAKARAVHAYSSAELIAEGRLWDAFDRVAANAVRALTVEIAREEDAELERIAARSARDEELRDETQAEFAALMEPSRNGHVSRGARDPLLAAVRIVADDLDVEARRPPPSARLAPRVDELTEIVRASGLFAREVTLRGKWWKEDAGPMIAWLAPEDGAGDDEEIEPDRPVALIRTAFGYELRDPVEGESRRVDAVVARRLRAHGRCLYRQLPDRPLSGRELVAFGAHGTRRDAIVFLISAIAVAGLSLLLPIASGQVLGTLIPDAQRELILDVCIGLLAASFVALLLAAVQNLAALRVEGRLQAQIQEGIWGRIMRLSPAFFRRYSTGDLATRALALTQVQELIGNLGIKMAIASVTAIANVILIVVYDIQLGLLTIALFAVVIAVSIPLGRRSLRLQRESFDHQREVNSRAFQLIGHVGKLRASAAEERAFAFWADSFTRGRDATYAARHIQNRFAAFAAAFALTSFAVVFFAVGELFEVSQPTFFVFTVAYAQGMAAMLIVVVTAMNSMPVVPLLEGMTPIIRAAPEVSEALADPGELSGSIELSGITFGYDEGGPTVIDDLSLDVTPGEFVAIVGPSGSGKSTLMRLMLGFESPRSGAILYDEQDLGDLDVSAVRRQCGVVLQDTQLFAGDILSNVVGSGVYTSDDAWEAIEMVGLDEDIAGMPMGMFTVLSEGAGTLSGGQRQRVAIARALVSRPRMIFLDEATSALDNITQQQVIESMRKMNATRVVVAHRLSTIRDADRIIVVDGGRIAEQGTFDELMDAGGTFHRLAQRQLA